MSDTAAARELLARFLSAEELRSLSDSEVQVLAHVVDESLPDIPEDQRTHLLSEYRTRLQRLLDDRPAPPK